MTLVYRVGPNHEDRLGTEESLWRFVIDFIDKKSPWRPIHVYTSRKAVKSDFLAFSHIIACTSKSRSILESILGKNVTFFPLLHSKREFYMTVMNNSLNCLDYTNLTFTSFKGGSKILIEKYAFIDEVVKNELVFTAPEVTSVDIYATEKFKWLIEEKHKLSGLKFELLWDSENRS